MNFALGSRWRFRSSEIVILAYFGYVALIAPFFIQRAWRPALLAAVVALTFVTLQKSCAAEKPGQALPLTRYLYLGILRDWLPLAATLIAFREMDWFTRPNLDHHLENSWIVWDRYLLDHVHMRAAVEAASPLSFFGAPGFLELCYLLVYAVAPVSIALLLLYGRGSEINRFWIAYLVGTLGVYALFPFFPSQPPRTVFPNADLPQVVTLLRRLNLSILGNYSIHSSVFPSAHVSSVFSAAWGLLITIPRKASHEAQRAAQLVYRPGWAMAAYGCCVAIATIYGRYHYAADVAAGFAMSFLGLLACLLTKPSSHK